MATIGPVGTNITWQQYYRQVRNWLLLPLFREINARIENAEREYLKIRQAIKDIPTDPRMAGLAAASARIQFMRIKKQHIQEFEREMRKHLGVQFRVRDSAKVQQYMNQFIRSNVDLIVTIPRRLLADMTVDLQKLIEADQAFDQQELKKLVARKYGSSGYNLLRITKDQTGKAIGNLNHIRQTDAGIREYIWSTSDDERVRPNHANLDGTRHKWTKPPIGGGTSSRERGHPGHGILCRCVALGVIPKKL